MEECPCGERGRDGTQRHTEIVATVETHSGHLILVCSNHLPNYITGFSRYDPNFLRDRVRYFDENYNPLETRTQTMWRF